MRKALDSVTLVCAVIWCLVGVATLATTLPHAPKATKVVFPSGHCIIDASRGETDGELVTCINTGKIATEADYQTACFFDGKSVVGLTVYNVSQGKFSPLPCGATIPSLEGTATGNWNSVVFSQDGETALVGAWSGDNWIIWLQDGSSEYGTSPEMVSYLQNIQSAEMVASLAQDNLPQQRGVK